MSTPSHIPDGIRQRLDALRGRLRLWQWVTGGGRVLAVVCALMLLSLLVDRTWRMDFSQRLLSLVLAASAVVWVVQRYLVRSLRQPITDDALVQRVEQRFPELRSAVISALQFSRDDISAQDASPVMVQSAIRQGSDVAAQTDFSQVLDWLRFKRFLALGAVALILPIGIAIAKPAMMAMWFQRNVLLSSVEWPKRTTLEIEGVRDGRLYIAKGGDLVITVAAHGEAPDDVRLTYTDADGDSVDDQLPLSGDGKYRAEFPGVQETFRFRVAGGDDRTPWIDVVLMPRPEVSAITASMTLPDYLQGRTVQVPENRMAFHILTGSQVTLDISANLPIASYTLTCDGDTVADGPTSGTAFSIALPSDQVRSGSYLLRLVSEDGVASLRPSTFALRLQPDREPDVKAELVGIGQLILARAQLPVAVMVSDDYGLASASLELSTESPTADAATVDQTALALGQADESGLHTIRHTIDLQPRGLAPETTLNLRAQALDVNTLTGPGVGVSSGFTLRIVTDDELRADFQRREQAIRVQFESALGIQHGLLDESRLFAAGGDADAGVAPARQLRLEKRQHRLIRTIDQMHRDYSQLRDELVNNRLESEPSDTRARYEDAVIAPLDELRTVLLPAAVDAVSRARASRGDTAPAAWRDAIVAQKRVIDAMLAIRKHLAQSEDVQKAIRLLQSIMDDQKDVIRDTRQKSETEIEGLFDD